jgi:hypothetical protein
MKKNPSTKIDAACLHAWLQTLPMGEYRSTVNALMSACKIPRYTFDNWRFGKSRIYPLAKDKIEEIAGKKIFV